MELFFPELTPALVKEYYTLIKQKALLKQKKEDTKEIDEKIYKLSKPIKFDGHDGAEIKTDKNFEEMCVILAQNLSRNPREMSVIEFYQSQETLKKQYNGHKPNKSKRPLQR